MAGLKSHYLMAGRPQFNKIKTLSSNNQVMGYNDRSYALT